MANKREFEGWTGYALLEPTAQLAAVKTEKFSEALLEVALALSLGTVANYPGFGTPGFGLVTPFYPGHSRPSCGEQKP